MATYSFLLFVSSRSLYQYQYDFIVTTATCTCTLQHGMWRSHVEIKQRLVSHIGSLSNCNFQPCNRRVKLKLILFLGKTLLFFVSSPSCIPIITKSTQTSFSQRDLRGFTELFNRPFVQSGHMVLIKLCWDANNAVGLSFVLKIPLHYLRPSIIFSVPCDRIVERAYIYIINPVVKTKSSQFQLINHPYHPVSSPDVSLLPPSQGTLPWQHPRWKARRSCYRQITSALLATLLPCFTFHRQ